MRKSSLLVLFAASLAFAVPAHAQHGHGGGHSSSPRSSSGSVHVRGYTSRSGKTVEPYTRNAPGEGRSKASGGGQTPSSRNSSCQSYAAALEKPSFLAQRASAGRWLLINVERYAMPARRSLR